MNVSELYSGIGGMHFALKDSGIPGQIVAAIEINPLANEVYKHNFPNSPALNRNIEGLTPAFINNLNANIICMSPPCQPFTRNGLQKDISDPRSRSLLHLLEILPELNIDYILLENVKSFEKSAVRDKLIETLEKCNFVYQEFILSPTQVGVPNTRHRYYCLAKKNPLKFQWAVGELMYNIPGKDEISGIFFSLSEIIENYNDFSDYLISDNVLQKHATLLDICHPESRRSCCFTKAYGRYVEGTGSVFTPKNEEDIHRAFTNLESLQSNESLGLIKALELRFFTPTEVARLMSFPECFSFPEHITKKQRYRLLGNSINVRVVSELIKILLTN